MRKTAGCCSLCGVEVFEVLTRHPDGRPRKVGKPNADAWRVGLVLADGAGCDVTICEHCLPTVEVRLPELWRNVLEGQSAVDSQRPYKDEVHRQAVLQTNLALVNNVPLGVVAKVRWQDARG
jgi:hypothetical protein